VEFLEGQIVIFQAEIQRQLPPFAEVVRLWRTLPGIEEVAAAAGDLLEVCEPLQDGDLIARRGTDELRGGTRVKVTLAGH
jgi:hypothetical protein